MPRFTCAGEFKSIVSPQDQIASLAANKRQAAEHQSLVQQLQMFCCAATLDTVDRQALYFVALPPKTGNCRQQSQEKNSLQRHQGTGSG